MDGSCIVLLSGGLDSAVALGWALRRFRQVRGLSFTFSGRAEPERRAARRVARAAGVGMEEIEIPFLREAGRRHSGRPRGYIPARNLVFYSVALARAEALGAGSVVGGHTRSDPARFPDASPPFFRRLESLAARAGYPPVRIRTPLSRLDKAGVVRLGLRLRVPLALTWSCYRTRPTPCGRCPACRERADAFERCGVPDPAGSGLVAGGRGRR